MKVTFFLSHFPNYSETFVIQQIVAFIDKGIDVSIISIWPGNVDEKHEIVERYNLQEKVRYLLPVESTNGKKKMLSRLIATVSGSKRAEFFNSLNFTEYGKHAVNLLLPTIIAKNNDTVHSDIFIAHFGTVGVIANKLKKIGFLKGKLATVFHGLDVSHKKTLSDFKEDYKTLFRESELILPISELWAGKIAIMGCEERKIHVSRMGIDISRFAYQERTSSEKAKKIISVARLTEKKGLEYAIKACSILKDDNIDFEYWIIGTGPLHESLHKLILNLGLENKVKLLGFVSQDKVKTILSESDVFLLPSVTAADGDMEGIPVALMEAMSVGLPVISTQHSGIPELIENGVSGWLAEERNSMQLADLLCLVLMKDGSTRSITQNARDTIVAKFNQEKLNAELLELIKNEV
ncbi:glycosyltransferase [Serratia proteamaculans]|uniref:glycosyltransferase n=1 Tax=Serratia proteamaculans TaxID=28151 RepID=UPI001075E8CA|nr:glycosyltransferase [Serratia proteamaculans]TFZ52097.1 glycosyltransferase [Serratia proteamaculans]